MNNTIKEILKSGAVPVIGLALSFNATAQKKPNLLFIMTDQQRYDALSIAGNSVLRTPNLDRLARQGAYFKNAYTPCAVSGPARACILTGTTVENNGVKTNGHTYYFKQEGLMPMPTFDEILTGNGYRCEYYGKWHTLTSRASIYKNPIQTAKNGKSIFGPEGQSLIYHDFIDEKSPKRAVENGELFDQTSKRTYIPDPLDKFYGKSYEEVVEQKLKSIQPDLHGKSMIDKEYSFTAFQAKQTIEAIERLKDSTFSITCSFHFPHAPMLPTEPYYGMYPVNEMVAPLSISDDMENSP